MLSQTNIGLLLSGFLLCASTARACKTISVAGFGDDCILSPCGGCDVTARDANGQWHMLPDVGEQLANVDTDEVCPTKLPVYFKTLASGRTLFLYYDASGGPTRYLFPQPIGYPDVVSGWAIGTSIGSTCTDGREDCGYGNVPSSCCSMGLPGTLSPNSDATYCDPWLMRQSEAEWNGDRHLPQSSTGTWQIRAKSCSCYASVACRSRAETRWVSAEENRAITITCDATTSPPLPPVFETAPCALDRYTDEVWYHNDATCRTSSCQGCCVDFHPDGSCEEPSTSCGCDGPNPILESEDESEPEIPEALASDLFNQFDANGNELLSRKEAKTFAVTYGMELGKTLNRYIRKLDLDNDRQLDLEEFLPMFEHLAGP